MLTNLWLATGLVRAARTNGNAARASTAAESAAAPALTLQTSPRVVAADPFRVSTRSRSLISTPQMGALALGVADIAAAACAMVAAYFLRFELEVGPLADVARAPAVEYAKLFVVIGIAMAFLAHLHQLYRTDSLPTRPEETYSIMKVVTIATGIGMAITFFYRDFNFSRVTLVYFWALSIPLQTVAHGTYRKWLFGRYTRGLDRRRTIVVGEPSSYLLGRLRSEPAFGVEVVGWVGGEERAKSVGSARGETGVLLRSAMAQERVFPALPRLGGVSDVPAILARGEVEQAVIVEHGLTHSQLLETIDACERHGVDIRLIPPIYDLLVQPSDLAFIEGVPLVRVDEARFHAGRALAKRAFDVALSAVLLVLLAPLLAVIAIAIRFTSPGPALFRQVRAGEHARPFEMLKFRTMVCDAEQRLGEIVDLDSLAEPVFKIAHDPRVTPVGRWLRRFSLDELPQLVNVLKGEMTIVGPRPEELKIAERYDIWQRRRLKMKPGITGLQQVEARGALSSLNERVRLDIYYTRQQSFLLDLMILARTVSAVLSGRGAT